jgi:D-arabinose 1-dehydrogenase-like Zn-dependent alcohol dehydrogenase
LKAFVVAAPNRHQVEEVPVPVIAPDELLIRVRASGICHSDYELMSGQFFVPVPYPVIPGHEWSGEVVEVGKNVSRFSVGDRVIGECAIGCGACPACQSGHFANCSNPDFFGFTIDSLNRLVLRITESM